ncbi:MAG: alpha-ketoacid dehydrogenase subunit beta [Chloroflexi bacterium]|nr:MAG: alpha-ketoacid dehydrogenase subunit beta [Chloroflexota bacterium]
MAERVIAMYEAIAEAIAQEMERDERVFVMGEDVGAYGGIFGATAGLWKKFGDERVRDTPISEMGFVGAAVGAALEGMRPIVEVMFIDFIGACMDQVLNHMSKIQYMSGGQLKVPVVLMTAMGGGYNDAAQHSQCLYGLFGHIPGVKVVIPSTPYDAKGLMIQAIRDDNPVMYFFHKGLMGLPWMTIIEATWAPVPEEPYTIPFGVADVKREGTDVTIVAVAMMVHRALEAAEKLAEEGISVEVIDLRTLVPLDKKAIVDSVKKTHRLLVVDEDYLSYGMTGEVIAVVAEEALDYLDAPPKRVAVPDVPIPYSNPLEDFVIPNADRIAQAVRELVS